MAEAHETTRILGDVGRGTPGAADRLLPLVYDDLRAAAEAQFRHQPAHQTLQPTALVHEAFMRLAKQSPDAWNNRTHFVAVASKLPCGSHAEINWTVKLHASIAVCLAISAALRAPVSLTTSRTLGRPSN